MKPVDFLGDSLKQLSLFPDKARRSAGHQLSEVQAGREPADWKPMSAVAGGVREIRVRDDTGAFRVFYLATLADRVLVLHAFTKTTQRTTRHDIDLAAQRLRAWRT